MRIIDWIMKVPNIEVKPLLNRLKQIRKPTIVVILLAVALPGVLLSLGFVHLVGTQKLYCLNCHVEQRDKNFWQKSAVHPDINCATCHDVGEGGALNAVFHYDFSAKEDVMTSHCEGCHKDDLSRPVGFDAATKGRPDKELIRIPHEMHIKDLGIKCTYCHYNVFHERRPAQFATYRPKMETCYSCHDESQTACESCHPGGLPSGVSMTGSVGGGRIVYSGGGYGEVVFSHNRHVGAGVPCESCHNVLFGLKRVKGAINMAGMFEGKNCGHCHNGRGAFAASECGRCHKGGAESGGDLSYNVDGFGPVTFSHDSHLGMGLECGECHTSFFGFRKTSGKMTMDSINKGKFCGHCHDGKKAFAADACDSCHRAG